MSLINAHNLSRASCSSSPGLMGACCVWVVILNAFLQFFQLPGMRRYQRIPAAGRGEARRPAAHAAVGRCKQSTSDHQPSRAHGHGHGWPLRRPCRPLTLVRRIACPERGMSECRGHARVSPSRMKSAQGRTAHWRVAPLRSRCLEQDFLGPLRRRPYVFLRTDAQRYPPQSAAADAVVVSAPGREFRPATRTHP